MLAEPAGLDAIYSYDAALVSDTGVVLLRPGKEARRDEPEELAPELERAGVPVLAQLEEPALAPRVALIPEHNAATRRRLETAGVEVLVYRADELSKGEGGPTCLTLPLTRGG